MANKNLREIFQVISEDIELGEEFNIEDVPEVELPENFNDDFHKKYLTITAAKNNSELMGHFKGKYLSSTDLKLKNGFIANGFTEDDFNELKTQEPDTLKLFDLVFNKVKEAKPTGNDNTKPDKAFEQYKKDTIKQIEELKGELSTKDTTFNAQLSDSNKEWSSRFKKSRINELLSGKTFDSSIPKDDLMMIINSKIDASNYLIKMEDDFTFKVYNKSEPDTLALNDGKELGIMQVIDEIAQPYTQKNDQPTNPPQTKTVTVPATAGGEDDGFWTPGHPNYKGGGN